MKKSLLTLVPLAVLLASCGGSGSGGASSTDGAGGAGGDPVVDGTLTYAINEDPGNLFRHVNSSATLSYVYPWAYESLLYFDVDGQAQSWLATEWEATPTSATFTIREGVMCSDDTELTPEVVANNFEWILDPENGSSMVGLVVPADTTVEFDDSTVTLTVETPNSFLVPSLGTLPMYCQAAIDDPDSVMSTTNGSGLFELTEAVPNDRYTFTRRDDYDWGPDGGNDGQTPGVPKEVVIRIVENPSTRANLLLSGEVNLAAVQGPDEDRVAATAGVAPMITSNLITGGFAYSQAEGKPTADEQVRVALTHALDLDALMRVQTADKGERAPSMAVLPPNICTYDAATPNLPAYDVQEAGRLLDEAGWTLGSDGVRAKDGEPLTIHLTYNTRWPETANTTELMKQQWEEVGAQVSLNGGDSNAFLAELNTEGSNAGFDATWLASNYYVPSVLAAFVSGPTPPNGGNYAGIQNAEFDEFVAQTSELVDEEACGAWEQAEAAMYQSADYVPFAMRPDVLYGRGVQATIAESLIAPAFILVGE